MKAMSQAVVALLVSVLAAGCASTKVSDVHSEMGANEKLARPNHIYVYDFAATAADLPPGTVAAQSYAEPAKPRTAKEIAAARQLSDAVANELAAQIRAMGLPGEVATAETTSTVNDIVLRGQFESVETGSAGKRIVLGFGSGSAELKTVVQVYEMTANGLRELGSGAVDSGGGKGPGLLVPLGIAVATANPIGLVVMGAAKVEGEASGRTTIEGSGKRTAEQIAAHLKPAFQRQGWIQ